MSKPVDRNFGRLGSLSIEELTQDLDSPAEREPGNSAEAWVIAEGYYPGSQVIKGSDLYANYAIWHAASDRTDKRLNNVAWGKAMSRLFRRTHREDGGAYYLSRIPPEKFVGKLEKSENSEEKDIASDPVPTKAGSGVRGG